MNEYKVKIFSFILITFILLSALFKAYNLFYVCLMLLLFLQFAYYWNKHIFTKLTVKRYLSRNKVQFGQELEYNIKLENRKLLPLLWLTINHNLSAAIQFTADKVITDTLISGQAKFKDLVNLRWYETMTRSYKITPTQRGKLYLHSATLSHSDLFGLFSNQISDQQLLKLIVFPRILSISTPETKSSRLFGTRPQQGWIFEDKLNKTGVRPYQSTDSFREINWKASARQQKLMADIYKPSLENEIRIFQGVKSQNFRGTEVESNILELSLVCTASLCEMYFQAGMDVGFFSNLQLKNNFQNQYTKIPVSSNQQQHELILTSLALIKNNSRLKFTEVLNKEKRNINPGATIIIIINELDDELLADIQYYKQYFQLTLITIGPTEKQIKGIEQYYLDEEAQWDEIETLKLYQ
jgi:uncharacterized protein (DUF58 family)